MPCNLYEAKFNVIERYTFKCSDCFPQTVSLTSKCNLQRMQPLNLETLNQPVKGGQENKIIT